MRCWMSTLKAGPLTGPERTSSLLERPNDKTVYPASCPAGATKGCGPTSRVRDQPDSRPGIGIDFSRIRARHTPLASSRSILLYNGYVMLGKKLLQFVHMKRIGYKKNIPYAFLSMDFNGRIRFTVIITLDECDLIDLIPCPLF